MILFSRLAALLILRVGRRLVVFRVLLLTVPLTAGALLLALTTSSWADLSWEYIEKRQKKQREVISQAKKDMEKVDQTQSCNLDLDNYSDDRKKSSWVLLSKENVEVA